MTDRLAPVHAPRANAAELLWPSASGRSGAIFRGIALAALGACLLTLSAKYQVPGPVPMTLQTLAVLALGAMLGARLAVASVVLYLFEGALGLPVFATTPPLAAGLPYLLGPTGGFLVGFVAAAALVGHAADRGLSGRPILFGLVVLAADALMLAVGWAWLATFAHTASGYTGIGASRAFAFGVAPFLVGEGVKVVLATLGLPLLGRSLAGLARRGA